MKFVENFGKGCLDEGSIPSTSTKSVFAARALQINHVPTDAQPQEARAKDCRKLTEQIASAAPYSPWPIPVHNRLAIPTRACRNPSICDRSSSAACSCSFFNL